MIKALVKLCRPQEWFKNLFLLAPLVFGGQIYSGSAVLGAFWAFAAFCLFSSAVYCWNDVIDAPSDRNHPRKRSRPVASGQIGSGLAVSLGALLAISALSLAWFVINAATAGFGALYLANSLAYIFVVKRQAILDILSIAVGFVIRLLAGCAAVHVEPSEWLLVCGFALALLLGFGKRRLELANLDQPESYRPSLKVYTVEKLNLMLGVSASICLLAYMLYSTSPQTIELHQTKKLVYTVPFVAYGVFRYIFKVQDGEGDGPLDVLVRDRAFLLNGALWAAVSFSILYNR